MKVDIKSFLIGVLTTVNLFLLMSFGLWAQQRHGSLRGLVTEAATGETIPMVNVSIKDSLGSYIIGGSTDFDGKYNINPIPPGTYTVEVSFLGFTIPFLVFIPL